MLEIVVLSVIPVSDDVLYGFNLRKMSIFEKENKYIFKNKFISFRENFFFTLYLEWSTITAEIFLFKYVRSKYGLSVEKLPE